MLLFLQLKKKNEAANSEPAKTSLQLLRNVLFMNLKIFTVQYYSTVQVYENKNVIIEHSYVYNVVISAILP